ncbi:MAG TPA: sugar phosphate isomerase/epimerase family protein [Tissierellales bacterium]|nr:sugar phosphate isomerase/epimerase family protein [Tissierellales bacterium]
MNKGGLCSITFRELSVNEIIELVKKAGLNGIEWGGDVHVPPGDFEKAKEVADATKKAGLDVVSYGSYYRVGIPNDISFETILETAVHLTAPSIRVWAGRLGSAKADDTYRKNVVEDAQRIAELAKEHNITIHFEYHGRTLTDTPESALALMKDVNHPNAKLYWQPAVGEAVDKRLESIEKVKPWLSHIHVFHWDELEKLPFNQGIDEWQQYINAINKSKGIGNKTRYFLMEFVKDDNPQQFLEDAKVLKKLLN